MSDSPQTPKTITISKCSTENKRQLTPQQHDDNTTEVCRPVTISQRRSGISSSAKKRRRLGNFKSPVVRRTESRTATFDSIQSDITQLHKKKTQLDQQIDNLKTEGYREAELQVHMCKMHTYNELKDTAQMLLGKLAELEGVPVKELYANFGLDIED